jgi:rubrerythrin
MDTDRAVNILKNAILLEKKGHAFYSNVALQSPEGPVKDFFAMMAEEEIKHIQILSEQFRSFQKDGSFKAENYDEKFSGEVDMKVITEGFKKAVSAADYEAAAVAAAMNMEENAVRLYSDRAAEASDENEKNLYEWLAKWEREHMRFLSEIDRELTQEVWNDNSFWPF